MAIINESCKKASILPATEHDASSRDTY